MFVCVHSGRRQSRCFEQRAAEHQAASSGDWGGEETTGGGDGSGNICPLFTLISSSSLNSALTSYRPHWSIGLMIFAVKALVWYFISSNTFINRTFTTFSQGNTVCVSFEGGLWLHCLVISTIEMHDDQRKCNISNWLIIVLSHTVTTEQVCCVITSDIR